MRLATTFGVSLHLCLVASAGRTAYDHIIVGGGSAGLVLAERLSRDPTVSVAVLEAGSLTEQNRTLIPALYSGFIWDPEIDWRFTTVPQKHVSDNVLLLPRGKTLGGTAAVNGMYFVRAAKNEYDAWETLGNPGWNWDTVNANIKALENFIPASSKDAKTFHATDSASNHGKGGPIEVTYSTYWEPAPLIPAYFSSFNALGIPTNKHASGGDTIGVWQAPCAIDAENRSRSYAVNTFLHPNDRRENLHIITGAHVTRTILADEQLSKAGDVRAVGVQYIADNETRSIHVTERGHVVITAGTYQTPKLLELSGIGNASILKEKGITARVDLPAVGENLQDHVGVLSCFELKDGLGPSVGALNVDSEYTAQQWELYTEERKGALASVHGTTVAMIPFQKIIKADTWTTLKASLDKSLQQFRGTPYEKQIALQRSQLDDESIPQIEFVLLPMLADPTVKAEPNRSYITIGTVLLRPFARGSVHLESDDPLKHPLIDPNYLGITEFETAVMTEALKFVAESLTQTKPLSTLIAAQLSPPSGSSHAELEAFVQQRAFSVWHPAGSASMLPKEEGGVVDPQLKVYGTENLHVADASIIPLQIGTHTMATVYANALRAGEIIEKIYHDAADVNKDTEDSQQKPIHVEL
ncbi:alcohol oxidase [Rickenella mellea]|uniref:Alcohol oxidase n=1 Tax=Rickenella mellea TaxID=50990 RepID=A0A4Y7PQN7_9AGAM|nr:alcohol oxidase [Rickenella mellea]